ncbi:MAG: hypothetical protein ABI689_11285 [Thermoanaerobaculia bacterium]
MRALACLLAMTALGSAVILFFDDGFESSFVDGSSSWSRPLFP